MLTTKESLMGEMKCIGPKAEDADLWILIWEELHRVHQEGILVEVDHVKADRTKKDMQQMSLFEILLRKPLRKLMSSQKKER